MIYLDNSATTPLSRPVLEAMWPYLTEVYGNPSSHHEPGRLAAAGLEAARQDVASVLGCRPGEVVFTSGGTEANNLAIKGLSLASPAGRHIVTTAIEHKAVLEACEALAQDHGFRVTVVPVAGSGVVDLDALDAALTAATTLCSVMYANNEVGSVQPVARIAQLCAKRGVPFHTDAVQAAPFLDLDVSRLGVSAMSISAHKFGGPKGIGALFLQNRRPLLPLVHGGGQERGRRPGTQNVAGAVGLAAALRLAHEAKPDVVLRLAALRDRLIDLVLMSVPEAVLTGHRTQRLAHHASFCFRGVGGEAVLQELEMEGLCCSSGSACAAGSDEASHVLLAMGIDKELASTAVRFTLGLATTEEQILEVAAKVPAVVRRMRVGR